MDYSGAGFVCLQVLLGRVQVAAHGAQVLVDELEDLVGLLGLEGEAALQVDVRQGVNDVAREVRVGVPEGDVYYACHLPDLGGLDPLAERVDRALQGDEGEIEAVVGLALDVADEEAQGGLLEKLAGAALGDELAGLVVDFIGVRAAHGDAVASAGDAVEVADLEGEAVGLVGYFPIEVQAPDDLLGVGAGFYYFDLGLDGVLDAHAERAEWVGFGFFIAHVEGGRGLVDGFHGEGVDGHADEDDEEGGEQGAAAADEDAEVFADVEFGFLDVDGGVRGAAGLRFFCREVGGHGVVILVGS